MSNNNVITQQIGCLKCLAKLFVLSLFRSFCRTQGYFLETYLVSPPTHMKWLTERCSSESFKMITLFYDTLTKRLIIELTSVFTIYPKTYILANFDFGDFQISELLSYTHVVMSRFPFYCILISAYWAPLRRIAKVQVLLKCK